MRHTWENQWQAPKYTLIEQQLCLDSYWRKAHFSVWLRAYCLWMLINLFSVYGHTHTWPSCPVLCRSPLSPLPSLPHPHCSSLTTPEYTWATWSMECNLCFQILIWHFYPLVIKIVNCPLVSAIKRQLWIFPLLFIQTLYNVVCLNLRWNLYK